MTTLKTRVKRLFQYQRGSHQPDKWLLLVIGLLLVFGLVSLSSASAVVSYDKFGGDAYYYFKHQLVGMSMGLVAFWIFSRIDYHRWRKYALGFLIFSIFLLLLVFIPGLSSHYGKARSWINVFGFSLQPSELVKISFLIYLAAWLERRRGELEKVEMGIGPFIVVLSLIGGLMILQPDIGTLSIIGVTSLIVYFIGGGKIYHILMIIALACVGFFVMVQIKPYQLDRFRCLIDPSYDTQKVCYQVNQSLIAVGTGGIFGRGLGGSRQKFMYVPEVSGDSIFAIIAEEMGLVVGVLLLGAFVFLFYRGYAIARGAPDDFGRIMAIGIVSWLTLQAIINIGGIVNIIPMTGVPLPFISYGGTAILAALTASGILVNISKQTKNI